MVIIIIIATIVFYCLPLPLKIILNLLNMIVPDGIPIIDELLMTSGTLAHIIRIIKVSEFADDHPILYKFIVFILIILIIGGISAAVYYLFN